MLLLAADFYYLKNIAGRRLVGLRWWNEVDTATGGSHWVFESQDRSGSVESGAPTQNATDKRFFWLALYAQPALWVALAIVSLVRLLNPIWLSLVAIALILTITNTLAFSRCDKFSQASSLASSAILTSLLILHARAILTLSLKSTGGTWTLGDISYYVPATPYTTVSVAAVGRLEHVDSLTPVTVVSITARNGSIASLESIVGGFASDDVWNPGFLGALLVHYNGVGDKPKYPSKLITLSRWNQVSNIIPISTNYSSTIPNGPYFLSANGALYQPYRLYSDFAGAFTQPLIPNSDGSYAALPAALPGIQSPAIGVPSRLYYTKTPSKPLAGVRLGVKDIYDVAGVKTSNGNRAVYGFYPPKTDNSIPVQRLIDAGAIIVGKMKTSQFANGELATADWVDYHSPFNPRGDGYQDPSSSSSGAGAGTGTYPWLDLTLGSDTGGSIRGPSQVQGLFGNRPTHGLVDLTGVMPLAPELDTAGVLCRDPAIWKAAGIALYADLPFYNSYPSAIQTIGFPTSATSEASTIILSFLAQLQNFLNAKTTALNLTTAWATSRPASAPPALPSLLNQTYPVLISKQQTRLVRDPFYAAYAAVHDGRKPFVDPAPLVRWAFGDSQPDSALTEARNNKTIFMDWFNSNILRNDSRTCSDSLLLYADGLNIQYRNLYNKPPRVPFGFSASRISVFSEVPDVVVPVGQAAYQSDITGHVEVLPVTVDIMAARGCDGM
ncbi:MAG: hypothetical protein Q9211_005769, partial [Gyalolechia sp. 1 TL-2023]